MNLTMLFFPHFFYRSVAAFRTTIPVFLLLLILTAPLARAGDPAEATQPAAAEPGPAWPLAKGNFWVYSGEVSYVEKDAATGKNEVRTSKITWRSEVVDVLELPDKDFLYLVRGFPTDLIWYEPGVTKPSERILLLSGTDYYQIENDAAALFKKLRTHPEGLREPGDDAPGQAEAQLLLPMPLADEKRFRSGTTLGELLCQRYCAAVESVTPFDTKGVRNCPPLQAPLCYSIATRTNPDHSLMNFVPGLGITAYSYSHHGTVSEVNVVLVEFGTAGQGTRAAAAVSR